MVSHHDIEAIIKRILPLSTQNLIQTSTGSWLGCPNSFVTSGSHENYLRYWSAGNKPSIDMKLDNIIKTMNKEECNN